MSTGWEAQADEWLAWARTPNHDSYWSYRDSFLALLPPPGSAALDLGCGEGRLARDLVERGYRVTGLDASPSLIGHAVAADSAATYVVGAAEEMPFDDGSFDLVVAHNSLMNVEDMPRSIDESSRVLAPRGRLVVRVIHPLVYAGAWASDGTFVVDRPYFDPRVVDVAFARDELELAFRDNAYPLEAYARAMEDAGLLIEALREPRARPGYRGYERWSRLPVFLDIRAVKP